MNTFKINDRVMYMSKKIYKIANIEEKDFGFGPQKYFVLVDEKTNNDILYLPTDNETALKNIRHLLTKKEIDDSIIYSFKNDMAWINSYKDRGNYYNLLCKENNMSKILCAVKLIMAKKKEFEQIKKNLPVVDLTFLDTVLNVINEEFSYVLKIKEDEVLNYILSFNCQNVLS